MQHTKKILTYPINGIKVIVGVKGEIYTKFQQSFYGIVQNSFNGDAKAIFELNSIAKENHILFVVYNGSVMAFGEASIEFIGSNGFRIYCDNEIVYEKEAKPGCKLPNGYGWGVVLLLSMIIIFLIIIKKCNREQPRQRAAVVTVPSLPPITIRQINVPEETVVLPITIIQKDVPEEAVASDFEFNPIDHINVELEGVKDNNRQIEEVISVEDLEQAEPVSMETTAIDSPKTKIDTLFDYYRANGLKFYELYCDKGYPEYKETAVRFLNEAHNISKDEQERKKIDSYINYLKSN